MRLVWVGGQGRDREQEEGKEWEGCMIGGCEDIQVFAPGHPIDPPDRPPPQLFDLRASAVRWEGNAGNGVTGLEFDRRVRSCL